MRRFIDLLAVALACGGVAGAGACGGGDGGPDAGPGGPTFDAALYPVACEAAFGRTFVLQSFALLPAGEGLDITGDGAPDNAIGFLWPVINPPWQNAIDTGVATYLVDVTGWDPLGPDDPDVEVATYLGLDADDPPDPSNNLNGEGEFLVPADQYDVNCRPLSIDEDAAVQDALLTVQGEEWKFLAPYIGTIEFRSAHMEFQFTATLDGFDALMAAAWSVCSMSRTFIPQIGDQSFLDLVVNQGTVDPDVEEDGDGPERIEGDGQYVIRCVDGDGTIIEGRECPCDPRMADRYSMSLRTVGVPASILGIYEP